MSASSAAHSPDRPAAGTGKEPRDPLPPADRTDEDMCVARPVPPAERAKVLAASAVLAAVIALGAALAVLDRYPFWFLVALWALALVLATAAKGWTDCAPSRGYLAVAALPFVVALLGSPWGMEPFPMETLGAQLLDSIALFALCLATSAYLGTYTSMHLNRQFVVALSFVLYVAVLTVRGPIGLYGDRIFQTNHIIDNDSFMANLMVCSFIGLVLALVVNRRLRRGSAAEAGAPARGEVSP